MRPISSATPRTRLPVLILALFLGVSGMPAAAAPKGGEAAAGPQKKHKLDHSGKRQVGEASVYSRRFAGKEMASGKPMHPEGANAASKTLPLGTTARVTNLETGDSARVTIEDRGPYVPGRIVDLSPGTARQIGLTPKQGVAPVEVAPIAVPQPDGGVKRGEGAQGARRR